MAALIAIADWLDYLRANGVYDNTRIILVSDHGYDLGQFEDLILDDGTDLQMMLPLLMYKDFNSTGYTESYEFITNADTPVLATGGLFDNPVNPFTQKTISNREKTAHDQNVLCFNKGFPPSIIEKTSFFEPGQPWYSVHDDVYDTSNWTRISGD